MTTLKSVLLNCMTELLHPSEPLGEFATDKTVVGGRPSAPGGTLAWPTCSQCGHPMQFLAQLRVYEPDRLMLLFMCQKDPGMCDEWSALLGANTVLMVATHDLALVEPPVGEATTRDERYSIQLHDVDEPYPELVAEVDAPEHILGSLGGEPAWIQDDETPQCAECETTMDFVAQLEEGPNFDSAMNFGGGGLAFVFRCPACDRGAFCWQC